MGSTDTRATFVKRAAHVFLVMALLVVMAACGGDDEPSAPADNAPAEEQADDGGDAGTITVGDQEANDHGTEDVSGATEVELEADDFYFEPTVLTGEAGQELTVTVANEGDTPHNFSITDQDIDENLDPGDEVEVSVTFPDSGTLVFFCSFHQSGGMLGGLEVGS
jgi:plastocyanin